MSEENVKEKKHLFKKKEKTELTVGERPRKKKKKVWIVILAVVVLLVAVIGSAVRNMTAQVEAVANTIEIEPVAYRDLSDSISIKGTVSGQSRTNVMSVASAEVTGVNVQVGDVVAAGDELVTLDTEDIEKQIAELKKNIGNANAIAQNTTSQKQLSLEQTVEDQETELAKAQNAVNKAKAECDKLAKDYSECKTDRDNKKSELAAAQQIMAENATDTEAYATAAAQADKLNNEIAALEAQMSQYEASTDSYQSALSSAQESYEALITQTNREVASAQNTVDMDKYQSDGSDDMQDQLDTLKKQLADCNLSAPCGGVVTAVNVSVGDRYTAGTTMITIEDTSAMKVVVTVEEANILKIQEGMKAIVTTDATGDEEIEGTVTRVVRVKNQSTGNSTDTNTATGYSAEISIDNTELLVGMSAKARIIIQERGNVLAVPYDLIQYDENGTAYVLVAEPNEDGTATAVRKNIEVGEEVDYYTEVTGGDLKEGDQLIYDYTYTITEGQIFAPEQMYSEQDLGFESDTVEAE